MHVRLMVAELCMALLSGVAYAVPRISKTGMCTLICNGYKKVVPCFAIPEKDCPVSNYKEGVQTEDSVSVKNGK
jgi:hypothetical protein